MHLHLHFIRKQAAASVYTCAEPAASETPSLGASMLLGEYGVLLSAFFGVFDVHCCGEV